MIARKATVITLIVCTLLVSLIPSVSGASDDNYIVDMRVGDTFSYHPETNMESVITLLNEVDGVTWDDNNGTLEASFDDVYLRDLNRQIVIKAIWTAPDAPDLEQVAFQGISFRTYGYLDVDGQRDSERRLFVTVGTEVGDVIYAPDIRTADLGTVNTIVCDIPDNPYIGWDPVHNRVIAKMDITSGMDDDLRFDMVVTNSHTDPNSTLREDSVTVSIDAHIGAAFAVTSPGKMESYVGSTDPEQNRYKVETDQDGLDFDLTITPPSDAPEGFVIDNGDGTISFDPSKVTIDGTHEDFIIGLAISAMIDGVSVTEVVELIYTVWATQEFLTRPSFDNVILNRLDGDHLSIVLSARINRAVDVIYDWGDGSEDSIPTESEGVFTANHRFQAMGEYIIVMSATSENGAVANHYVKYDAEQGTYEVFGYDPSITYDDGFPWWIVTLFIAIALTITYLILVPHPMILILDVLCSIATIVLEVV